MMTSLHSPPPLLYTHHSWSSRCYAGHLLIFRCSTMFLKAWAYVERPAAGRHPRTVGMQ